MLNRAGRAASLHVEAGRRQSAAGAAVRVIEQARVRIERQLVSAALAAAEAQDKELKSYYAVEVKAIDLGKIYKEGIKAWAKRHVASMIQSISDTTRSIIGRILKRGVDEGKSNKDIAKEIRGRLTGPQAARRAMTIARTETHAATQRGSNETAKQSTVELEKEWGATEDERTRKTHAIADGQVVDLDELFVVGGALMAYPGDPRGPAKEVINCRCVALYWPKGMKR